jgi:beta-xylosidase
MDDGLNVSPRSTEVLRATQPGEMSPLPFPNDALVTEAPFVVRRGATYFMTWSANPQGTPEYAVGVATAPSPTGPWKKSADNPILRKTDAIWAPGHQCLIDSPDGKRWFMMYHVRDPKDPGGERRLAIDRARFTGGDAPTIHVDGPTSTPQPLPLDSTADPSPPASR